MLKCFLTRCFVPFQQAWEVTLHFRNGRTHIFTCLTWQREERADELLRLEFTGLDKAYPVFYKLSDIMCITKNRVWRWRS